MAPLAPHDRTGFEVALICALKAEADAVHNVFDLFWEDHGKSYGRAAGDHNLYTTGVIGDRNVVLAYTPAIGKAAAAAVAANLRLSFPHIKLALVVGVCGGAPGPVADGKALFLGDVVISTALVQYDFGRQYEEAFQRKNALEDVLSRPAEAVRHIIAKLTTKRYLSKLQSSLVSYLEGIQKDSPETRYPGFGRDHLYSSTYLHKHRSLSPNDVCVVCSKGRDYLCPAAQDATCDSLRCEHDQHVLRFRGSMTDRPVTNYEPTIHFGRIGSGDRVLKSARHRDMIAENDGILAFEMEGAGVWDQFPTILIKGVCDYADSHKNKEWQPYAAAVAAACMKALLDQWTTEADPRRRSPSFSYTHSKLPIPSLQHDLPLGKTTSDEVAELVVKAIDIIHLLHERYKYNTDKLMQTFLQELSTDVALLNDVRELCDRLHFLYNSSGTYMRIASLKVQLEDYIADLDVWRMTSERQQNAYLTSGRSHDERRFQSLVFGHRDRRLTTRPEIQPLLQSMFKLGVVPTSTEGCEMITNCFRVQRQDVETSLSVLRAELLQNQAKSCERVRMSLEVLGGKAAPDSRSLPGAERSRAQSHFSETSDLATSRYYEDRLRDVQSFCSELSEKVNELSLVVSTSSSHTSSHPVALDIYQHPSEDQPFAHDRKMVQQKSGETNVEPDDGYSVDYSSISHDELGDDEDLQAIFSTCRNFDLIARRYFDSIVADYMAILQQWAALCLKSRLVQKIKSSSSEQSSVSSYLEEDIAGLSSSAIKLIALRRRAHIEGLQDSILEADEIFGIGDDDVAYWEMLTLQQSERDRLKLPEGTLIDSRLIVNEWMLKELFANPHLAEYQKAIVAYTTKGSRHNEDDSRTLQTHNQWERQVLKFWFLDSTASLATYKQTTTSFSMESEMTATDSNHDEDGGVDVGSKALDADPATVCLKQPTSIFQMSLLQAQEMARLIDQPPERVSLARRTRSVKALEEYQSEVAKRPDG